MALRTIEAPGVEIKEIDKSGYTPAMTGTRCFVMGYSDKGTPYEPMQFTSKAAWQNFYGDPDNEAERYFYNACSEVINQNGVLYCARIPYDNDSKDKMVGFKFKVSNYSTENPTAGEYLQKSPVKAWVDHDSDFEQAALKFVFDNKCLREIDGNIENGLENDTEIQTFYNAVIKKFNATYNTYQSYQRCSIDYYKFNQVESVKLSARYHTFAEAVQKLEEYRGNKRLGNYMYYVGWDENDAKTGTGYEHSPCILSDEGDWLVLPCYCEYNKEAIICAEYDQSFCEKELSNVAGLCAYVQTLSDKTGYKAMATYQDLKDNLCSIVATDISSQTILWDASQCIDDFETEPKEGKEIRLYGYIDGRVKTLNQSSTFVKALDLYKAHEPTWGWNIPTYVGTVNKWTDGAYNEYMMDNTTSVLYYDEHMRLFEDDKEVKPLWESELWKPYKSMNLKQIIRENQKADKYLDPSKWENRIDSWGKMLEIFKKEGNIKFEDLFNNFGNFNGNLDGAYGVYQDRVHDDVPYYRLADLDPNLHDYLTITQSQLPITCSLAEIDEYATGESKVAANTFWVFDKTCGTLNSVPEDSRKGEKRQMIGIFPVITTVANAIYAQSLISVKDDEIIDYETINGVITKSPTNSGKPEDCNQLLSTDVAVKFSQEWKSADETGAIDTVSRDANGYFLPVQMNSKGDGIDMENAKKIGVVVYKAYLDASEGNKVSFTPVESFCGSLDKDAKNPNTGASTLIDKIINTQSEYIYFFSNCFANAATKKEYDQVADFFVCKTGKSGMLGWFGDETKETIALTGIYQGIDKCFQKIEDINERDVDIICDAGLANIAQYMKSIWSGSGAHYYDIAATDDNGNPLVKMWKASDVNAWKTVQFKFDNFCKNVRKDCMFIADGPRPLVLQGEKKIIRPSKPTNTIDANILPNVKYCTGLNTNYGAGYMDWFQITDEFTGDEFWCPPSIKAMGVYINTDLNYNYWDAPAGLNRGVIQALDVSFSPTSKQAGPIYQKNWNYAINYPNDGIVLEGQKTFQVKPSAFDRVNVRRMFLRLERQTYKVARYFVYEGNTDYTRRRLIDMLDPIFAQAKTGGGIYDYRIVCDESNNTPDVIDVNELRVKIGIKPVKTAEFICIDFIALRTGGSFSEM